MARYVFISYSSVDKPTADAVCAALEEAGLPCWIAPRDVVAGTRYAEAIVDAIREAKVFVLVFSAAANASVQVEREVDRAVSLGLPVLPLRIEDVVPSESLEYYLAGQHWLDAFAPPLEEHLAQLCEAVRSLLGRPEDTTTAPVAGPSTRRAARQERRVVTVLASELSRPAAPWEQADPEDVDAALLAFEAMARRVVEAHGGAVQKSVGDSVTAVFGVPSVHEDDAERAVLAGLALVEQARALSGSWGGPCEVRAGVHTGEALVHLDADPAAGEGLLTGDVLTVASRLQSLASATGVVVSASTHALTAHVVTYEPLEPATGAAPVAGPAWLAQAPRRRTGGQPLRGYLTTLVGRKTELAYLEALFEKAAGSSSPQVALIIGEPGIGKSRLVAELFRHVDSRPDAVMWRQGRCLPYGEGVTFWALGEVFKAHARILETDDLATAQAKLGAIVPEGPDGEWLRTRLRALLGLEAPPASPEENAAAWLRLLEELASACPAIVVIEDLHLADEALLAFLEYFASNVAGVPLLLVGTARPELFEKHPSFAASISRVNRIALEPLSSAETERLVAGLLEAVRVPVEVADVVIARSEGNPFYAEESVRLLRDRAVAEASHVLAAAAPGRETGSETPPVPGSVQAVIAARLDTLPPAHKAVLADAAIIGNVFWAGAAAALGDREPGAVDEALGGLVAKQLIHRMRDSSMAGESEFSFWHTLAREVAYGQLPRAVRAGKHAAAAAWIEGKAGERVEDLADVLAHHYVTALNLARAAGDDDLALSVVAPAVRNLGLAGDRAWPLDVATAEHHYARALELAGAGAAERPRLLAGWAKAVRDRGRRAEAVAALEEAIQGLRAAGEGRAAALLQIRLADALPVADTTRSSELAAEAVAQLEADGPSAELVEALDAWVEMAFGEVDPRAALAAAERSLHLAEQLGLPVNPRALCGRGAARCDLGDSGGLDDLKRALEMARAMGAGEYVSRIFWDVGTEIYYYEGALVSLEILREGLGYARRRGAANMEALHRAAIIWTSASAGKWDVVLDEAPAVEALLEASQQTWWLAVVRLQRLAVLVETGRAAQAAHLAAGAVDSAHRESGHIVAGCSTVAAAQRMAVGDRSGALDLLRLSEEPLRGMLGYYWVENVPLAVRTALAAGDQALAERLAGSIEPLQPLCRHAVAAAQALVAEARGEREAAADCFADAASGWDDLGMPYEAAQALLGRGRCLMALDRAAEASPPLEQAREILRRLGAKPALAETDALLEKIGRPGVA